MPHFFPPTTPAMAMSSRNVSVRHHGSRTTHETYALRVHRHRLFATVTRNPAIVRRWRYDVLCAHRGRFHRRCLVVGLGVQWRYDPYNPGREPVATIQLCVGHRCLVFQLLHASSKPRALSRFLSSPSVTFVNVGTKLDKRKLWEHCGLHVEKYGNLAKLSMLGRVSLEEMARRFLGWELDYLELNPREVGLSDWEAWFLDEAQVQYACMDVWTSFLLGIRFGVHRLPRESVVFIA